MKNCGPARMPVISIVCYPFIVSHVNPPKLHCYRAMLCQRFLPASTFLSSSLRKTLVLIPKYATRNLLQLRRKILAGIIIIPAFLPQMCVIARYLSLFLSPVYNHAGKHKCTYSPAAAYVSSTRRLLTLYRKVLKFVIFFQRSSRFNILR
jgi:hypothetical protein